MPKWRGLYNYLFPTPKGYVFNYDERLNRYYWQLRKSADVYEIGFKTWRKVKYSAWMHKLFNMSIKSKRTEIIGATYDDRGVLTVDFDNGEMAMFKGRSTVWHHWPYMERCSSQKETYLCDLWEYIRCHGNPYPTAHLKNIDNDNS